MEVKDDNLRKYYDYLVTAKADVPSTYESFSSTLADEANAKQYYDYLKANKFDAPDTYESFSETLGLKKKDLYETLGFGRDLVKEVFGEDYTKEPKKELRADGTPKGEGYFGKLKRPDGDVSTELSIGVNLGGKETEIPTLVPTLSEEEKNYLLMRLVLLLYILIQIRSERLLVQVAR